MLGENIYNLRKSKKLSQEQLAEKINVTRQTISNWELGETSPNPEQLKLLSKTLNVSIDELLNNETQNVLMEKVSNTEKLAGIIIQSLKIIGIVFLFLFIIDIISLLIFIVVKKDNVSFHTKEIEITCSIKDDDYLITIANDAYFNCSNCSQKIQKDIKEIIDYSDIDRTKKEIETYFSKNNGSCE